METTNQIACNPKYDNKERQQKTIKRLKIQFRTKHLSKYKIKEVLRNNKFTTSISKVKTWTKTKSKK